MLETLTFPFVIWNDYVPDQMARPLVPVTIRYAENEIQTLALLDSDADINLMPFQLGLDLGFDWDTGGDYTGLEGLGGGLAAKKSVADLYLGSWPSIRQIFAWARNDDVPVILGQWNFFEMVDVCISRTQGLMTFELPK